MIKPTLHHVNLKTTRMQEMIDWYGVVVGATVNCQSPHIAFISNDRTHHRIALLAIPGVRDDPEKFVHTGIHHTAFEYNSFDDLMASFARLIRSDLLTPATAAKRLKNFDNGTPSKTARRSFAIWLQSG